MTQARTACGHANGRGRRPARGNTAYRVRCWPGRGRRARRRARTRRGRVCDQGRTFGAPPPQGGAQGDSSAGGNVTNSRRRPASSYLTTSGCGTASAGRCLTADRRFGKNWRQRGRWHRTSGVAAVEVQPPLNFTLSWCIFSWQAFCRLGLRAVVCRSHRGWPGGGGRARPMGTERFAGIRRLKRGTPALVAAVLAAALAGSGPATAAAWPGGARAAYAEVRGGGRGDYDGRRHRPARRGRPRSPCSGRAACRSATGGCSSRTSRCCGR